MADEMALKLLGLTAVIQDQGSKIRKFQSVEGLEGALETIQELEYTIQDHENEIQDHENTIKEREEMIDEHVSTIEEHEETIDEHVNTIYQNSIDMDERVNSIERKRKRLHKSGDHILTLESKLEDIETRLAAEKDHISDLEDAIRHWKHVEKKARKKGRSKSAKIYYLEKNLEKYESVPYEELRRTAEDLIDREF